MLVSRILFTIAAVAVSFDVVSAGRDGDQVSSVIPDNSLAKRFLRTSKAIEEGNTGFGDDKKNDVEDDQERGTEKDIIKRAPLPFLDDVAADLANLGPNALRLIEKQNKLIFKSIEARHVTPDDMATKLAARLEKMSPDEKAESEGPAKLLLGAYTDFWKPRNTRF